MVVLEAATPVLGNVDRAIVIGFLVLVCVVGYVMSKAASKGMDDYFLGGNKIPWWVLGISTATSNFDMAGTMIIVAVVYALGFKGFLVELRGGVGLSLAFLLVFLAKWLRRSRVMTSAEWMRIRFGTDRQGRVAHLMSAVANIVLSLGMIVYFCKGAGKFLTYFLPYSEMTCTTGMVTIGLYYTLMSGLYGVVFTDVVQMILMTLTAVYVSVTAFNLTSGVSLPEGFLTLDFAAPTGAGAEALLSRSPETWDPIFGLFGICVLLWLFRTMLEGAGGVGGYTDQRFFAARSEREASLLTFEAIVLSVMRWTMVAGLVIMGYHIVQTGGPGAADIIADPENVLPVVLGQMLPVGIKGLVIAGLIAAAMSTFDSTLNAGASYMVRDIYQTYLRPDASSKQLITVSRWSTAALCLAGVVLASFVPNINQIWGLITMGLGAGLFVPNFLRWYWPRFNGFGYAGGTMVGLVVALVVNTGLGWPLYTSFPTIIAVTFIASIVVTLFSERVPESVLVDFYVQINPWGFWRSIAAKAQKCGALNDQHASQRQWEKINDAIALCIAIPFQLSLLLGGMALIFHDWAKFSFFVIIGVLSGVGMVFFWYKNLKSAAQCAEEDATHDERQSSGETS
jgi:SSS family solute:Na+ symporter